MTIVLDKPEQINMWILLSRRMQLKMQLHGMRTPGLVKWMKAHVEGCENARTAKQCIVPLEYLIASLDGPQDFSVVNIHVMYKAGGLFHDQGIFNSPDDLHAGLQRAYAAGKLEVVYTLDEPRESNGQIYVADN